MYTIDYFIKKFEAIPEKRWLVLNQGDVSEDNNGNHCAIGHCKNAHGVYGNSGMMTDDAYSFSPEATALAKLFSNAGIFGVTLEYLGWNVADVNNGNHPKYKQKTPKKRILAALHDIKKLSNELNVQECDATMPIIEPKAGNIKTVIKYVSVPETISKSVPETILS